MLNNIQINPKGTVIGRAVDLNKVYSNFLFKIFFFLFWVIGLASISLGIAHYFLGYEQPNTILGLSYIAAAVFLFYIADRSFYLSKVMHPEIYSLEEAKARIKNNQKINLFSIFSFELAKATSVLFSKKGALNTKELASNLIDSKDIDFILVRLGIGRPDITSALNEYSGTDGTNVIFQALENAILLQHDQIEVGDVFGALCQLDPFFQKMIKDLKLDLKDVMNIVYWQSKIKGKRETKKKLGTGGLRLTGGIGKDWAFGWTPFLKQFSADLSSTVEREVSGVEIIGHDNEIDQIQEALLRQTGGNVVLVGEAGIGKRTTVYGFAKRVVEGKTSSDLDFKHIIKIDIDYLISGLSNPGEMTERISGIFNEALSAGNIIIYIENFNNLLSSGDAGKIDATELLIPYLDAAGMHIIATTDVASYNQYIVPNSALSQRFTRVTINEPNEEEMVRILEDVTPLIEYQHKCFVSYEAIKATYVSAEKYILNIPNPEKSINLLEGAAAKANSERGKTIILAKDILDYVSEKFEIPAGEVKEGEKQKLLQLEAVMHQNVIGQNEAISAISNALRRSRAGVEDSKKPIGSFLFLGPTGVGKTETAKALARAYFGDAERMIRFDMSEYQNKEDIYRLIGSNLGSEENQGVLTTQVREHPFSLLLFDEIEKAHRDILDLFLQIMDEGFVSDGSGRKVSFRNTIIIATSNAGANLIRESIRTGVQYDGVKKTLLDYLQKENIYRPEFLNRFTQIVAFSPLSQEEIVKVAALMIEQLKKDLSKNKGISLEVAPDATLKLAKLGFDPEMGARPMARVIQEKLENLLATKILSGELKQGDTFTATIRDIK